MTIRQGLLTVVALALAACDALNSAHPSGTQATEALPPDPPTSAWRHYGGSLEGRRFAADVPISPQNVTALRAAWQFQTGDVAHGDEQYFGRRSSFKATPVYFQNTLIVSTGFNRVMALKPDTGEPVWSYDPKVDFSVQYSEMFTSRGVAVWSVPDSVDVPACRHRVYLGTLDARLIALDAQSGEPCSDFGRKGEVDLSRGIDNFRRGEYSVTSPPLAVNGVVVVGSSIGDNGSVSVDEGVVRAFDAITGALRWRFDPVPKTREAADNADWQAREARRTGAGNVWSVMSADAARDLVFLPTTSPSPDFYGGERAGDNRHTNSIVALRASTGALVWAYQVVRHDLWDYDLASQPLLIDLEIDGTVRPALAQATKMGFVFVLDRQTGEPLHEVTDRPVPTSDIDGELAASHQRFPAIRLHGTQKNSLTRYSRAGDHAAECDAQLSNVRYDGIYTPPSLQGSVLYPGNPGGVNWGSMAADPNRGVALVAVNRLPTVVKLIPRSEFESQRRARQFNGVEAQFTAQSGTPYGMARYDVYSRSTGIPCHEGPWSTLAAVDLATGDIVWETPVGRAPGLEKDDPAANWGYFVKGGPMLTAGGVVFLATPFDFTLRAHDLSSGAVLWSDTLPAEPGATPMAYTYKDKSYVALTAGGRRQDGSGQGDYVIAYQLDP